MHRILLALLALFASGCGTQFGIGVHVTHVRHEGTTVGPQFRWGVHPLQLVPSEAHRDVDVGAGIVLDGRHLADEARAEMVPSAYLEVTGVTSRKALQADGEARVLAGGAARLAWDHGDARPGVEPIVKAEVAQFTNKSKWPVSYGELAVGLYLSGFFDRDGWGASTGLFGRMPFTTDFPDKM